VATAVLAADLDVHIKLLYANQVRVRVRVSVSRPRMYC
jgi:hypothetical protein